MYPILFEFGPITVFSLWFFIAVGFVAGSFLFVRLAKRHRVKLTILTEHGIILFLFTLVVSRIFFVVLHSDLFFYDFSIKSILGLFAIWDKGLSFWGAVLAWFAGIFYFSRKYGSDALRLYDLMIISLLFGLFFGNIGAFLDGINHGSPTKLAWGMTFRSANVKYISPIHPTQLYSALYTLLLGSGLILVLKKLRHELPGFITELGVFIFSFLKFIEEFFRGDETIEFIGIRLALIIALFGIIASAYLIRQRYLNKNGGDPELVLQNFVSRLLPKKLQK